MGPILETEYIGKYDIVSHFCRCEKCRRLTVLSTYSTSRFVKLFRIPFIPSGRRRMLDECPLCGHRDEAAIRKHAKLRKRNLASMMDGFASDADNPDHCCEALRTLMVYDEETWFRDVRKSYGLRFEAHMQVQLVIAQGLCRFGDFEEAITYCRKAIVLGASKPAEELMEYCHRMLEAKNSATGLEAMQLQPESARKAYIPIASLASAILLFAIIQGITAMRTHSAWLVNGSTRYYSFTLDDEIYTLAPGASSQIKLRLGKHKLQWGDEPAREFNYSISLLKQLLEGHLLVINPDSMALLALEGKSDEEQDTTYWQGKQIHILHGVRHTLFGFKKEVSSDAKAGQLNLFRPNNHMKMVTRLTELGLPEAAGAYAKRALAMNPAEAESAQLLPVALMNEDDTKIQGFLKQGMVETPALLPWHLYYQQYMSRHHPEHSLAREYTQRCKNNPNDPATFYLLGCVLTNRTDAHKFFLRSEKDRGMGGLGYHAIAYDLFLNGEFRKALPFSRKAVQRSPRSANFRILNEEILLALRDFDTLLESKNRHISTSKQARNKVLYLTCAGYHREAEKTAQRFAGKFGLTLPELNAIRLYAVGNIEYYLDCVDEAGDRHAELEKLLHQNRIADAHTQLTQNEDHPYWEHFVLYIAAMNQSLPDIAGIHLNKAVDEVDPDKSGHRKITGLFSGDGNYSADDIKSIDIPAQEKAILCVALGYRFPDRRDEMNALSNLYNFTPAYPQLLLKKWTRPTVKKPSA